ncbi:hypothetical protein AB0L70_31540 [Kribbella sp. NPDC051952]|uniref:hypothetical protein n=1 Tax=Kribbella sp. NPDC051952 TaxID=3154851 RepID=UPI00341CB133
MPTPPQVFVDVLAQRLADYSGRDYADVRATVMYAGDELPVRIADLMLADARDHAADESNPQQARNQLEYESARRRLIEVVQGQVRPEVGDGIRTEVQARQHARAVAERIFALAVDVVEPIAVDIGVPQALERQRETRIAAALGTLRGLPAARMLAPLTLREWLKDADRLTDPKLDDGARDRGGRLLANDIELRRMVAAGYQVYESKANPRSPDETIRDGVAIAWSNRTRAEFTEALGVASVLGPPQTPERLAPRMVTGLVQSIAERTGTSEQELLERLCTAGGEHLRGEDQWRTVSRLLVPDESLQQADEVEPSHARQLITDALRTEFSRQYGDPDRSPEWSPEEGGARITTAGAELAASLGIGGRG